MADKFTDHYMSPSTVETEALRLFAEGESEAAFQMVARYLDDLWSTLNPQTRSTLSRLQFDIAEQLPDAALRREAARQWLEALADDDESAWLSLHEPSARATLEQSFVEPSDQLELLELLSFAPASTGLSDESVTLIEDFGYSHAADPELSREAERLLHALGNPEAAYRVEHARRAAIPRAAKPARKRDEQAEIRLTGLIIAIAGGHPALRRAIQNDLKRAGAKEIREIPPRWEGSRQGREIVALLAGVDIAVLIGRHIAHSTVDQVKRGASLAGIPVLASHTASASGVRRALEEHLKSRRLDKPSRPT
jgi:hypothetical protein